MTTSNTTPQEMIDAYLDATNSGNRRMPARTDAVYHIGKLMTGDWTPGYVTSIQAGISDQTYDDYDPEYEEGYWLAWNTVADLFKGFSLKMIAKEHG